MIRYEEDPNHGDMYTNITQTQNFSSDLYSEQTNESATVTQQQQPTIEDQFENAYTDTQGNQVTEIPSVATPINISPPQPSERDWNLEFQTVLELAESEEQWIKLSELFRDFVHVSKAYGRIVITEKGLPNELKTVKLSAAGGRAGGLKYEAQGILFKFAVDIQEKGYWIYGISNRDDHLAAKAAGHELKGLINLLSTSHLRLRLPGTKKDVSLHYPLMALIDYRGYRLNAISKLPINRETLVYGSADAGRNVFAEIPELNDHMKNIAQFLNLEGHHVGGQPNPMWLCGDIEVHLGTDSRFYCIDLARVFPPQLLQDDEENLRDPKKRNYILFELLRPELVKSNKFPLNSDARSKFNAKERYPDEVTNAKEGVKKATDKLLKEVIPDFAQYLAVTPPVEFEHASFSLTDELHFAGINCRHLGRVRQELGNRTTNEYKTMFVLTEIVARTCKNELKAEWREKMEELKVPASEPYKKVAVNYFNKLLQDVHYWSDPKQLKDKILEYFQHSIDEDEMQPSYDLRKSIIIPLFFSRLQKLSEVKLERKTNDLFKSKISNQNLQNIKLLRVDIKKMAARVKQLDLIDIAEGKALYLKANDEANREQAERLFKMASKYFSSALSAKPNNPEILYWWAQSLRLESKLYGPNVARSLLLEAKAKLERCCKLSHKLSFDAYFWKIAVLVQLTSLYTNNRSQAYQYQEEIKKCLEILKTNKKDTHLDEKIFNQANQMYCKLNPIAVEERVVENTILDRLKISYDSSVLIKRSEESIDKEIVQYVCAYHWHRIFLSRKFSSRIIIQAANILHHWGVLLAQSKSLSENLQGRFEQLSENLFARAGQVLEIIFLSSPALFPISKLSQSAPILKLNPSIFVQKVIGQTDENSSKESASKEMICYEGELRYKKRSLKSWHKGTFKLLYDGQFVDDKGEIILLKDCEIRILSGGRRFCIKAKGFYCKYEAPDHNSLQEWFQSFKRVGEYFNMVSELSKSKSKSPISARTRAVSIPRLTASTQRSPVESRKISQSSDRTYKISLLDSNSMVPKMEQTQGFYSRLLIPTVHRWYPDDNEKVDKLFSLEGYTFSFSSTYDIYFTFDFGEVELDRMKIKLHRKLVPHSLNLEIILADLLILFCKSPLSENKWQEWKSTKTVEKCNEFLMKNSKLGFLHTQILQDTDVFEKLKQRGSYFYMKIIPKQSMSLQSISFYGKLLGLYHKPNFSQSPDADSRELRKLDFSNEGTPEKSEKSPRIRDSKKLKLEKSKKLSKSEGSSYIDSSIIKNNSELIEVDILEKAFVGYSSLAAILRMAEHSEILSSVIKQALNEFVKNHFEDEMPKANPEIFGEVLDFMEDLPENWLIKHHNDPYEISYEKINFYGCTLVNKFILTELSTVSAYHSIDLSYTDIRDEDISELIYNRAKSLKSLKFKGCKNLTHATMETILKYCHGSLRCLGVWVTASEHSLRHLSDFVVLDYLDLSGCKVNADILERHLPPRLKYLNLSHIIFEDTDRKRETIRLTNLKCLEALILRRNKHDRDNNIFSDEFIRSVVDTIGNRLKILDLSYCLRITAETLKNLTTCTNLMSLKLNGLKFDIANIVSLLKCLPEIRQFEIITRLDNENNLTISITDGFISTRLTSLTLRMQRINDNIVDIIERNSSTLEKLDLSMCGEITDLTAAAISKCSKLIEIQLHGCIKIKEKAFNNILQKCSKLKIVGLLGCDISDKTLYILRNTKKHSRACLHTLMVGGCPKLTTSCFKYLKKHKNLKILKMSKCQFITPKELFAIVKEFPKLAILDISGCDGLPLYMTKNPGSPEEVAYANFVTDLTELLPLTKIIT